MFADHYEASHTDVTYLLTCTFTNDIAVGGKIVITFPEDDYVLDTTPTLECAYSGGLADQDASTPIRCYVSDNTVIIDQFAMITSGVRVTFKIKHLLNPPDIKTTGFFFIESYSESGYLQDGEYEVPGLAIK